MNDSDLRPVPISRGFDDTDMDETPAERLRGRGATALTDAELLSLFVAGSAPDALATARRVLAAGGGLENLHLEDGSSSAAIGLSVRTHGLLQAAHELVRRRAFVQLEAREKLSSPEDIRRYFALRLAGLEHEVFAALFLDSRTRVIEYRELFRGTVNGAAVYPREVVKACLSVNAASVVFAHNHPSQIAEASDTDIRLTRKLVDALALIDVSVIDHVIVARGVHQSLAEQGLM